MARKTGGISAVPADEDAHVHLVLLLLEIVEEPQNAGKTILSLNYPVSFPCGEVQPRPLDVQAASLGKEQELVLKCSIAWLCPRVDGAFCETLGLVGDNTVQVQRNGVSKPLTFRAGAERVVERE